MMQEIVFTSARRGLRSGSTGFCTVRSTRGMPGNLAQLLERLTGYAHVFDAYGSDAGWNPVSFAHYVARLGGQRFHILARISNAPLDHTNRSNKLAHVLTTDSAALAVELSEGPASESLQIPWIRAWSSDSEPTVLSDDHQLNLPMAAQVRTGICEAWKDATGDAGWAAVLAFCATDNQTPLQIILPRDVGTRSEDWTLRLVNEALSLLPPESRWDVSYSTFFTGNLPVSISCQWQFVLDGTDLARKARLDPRSRTIDLVSILEKKLPAPKNELTAFAQTGSRPWSQEPEAVLVARRRKRAHEQSPFGANRVSHDAYSDSYDDLEMDKTSETLTESAGTVRRKSNSPPSLPSSRPLVRRPPPLKKMKHTALLLRPSSLLLLAGLGISIALVIFSAMQKAKTNDGPALIKAKADEKSEQRRRDREEREASRRQADEQRVAEELRLRAETTNAETHPEAAQPVDVSPDLATIGVPEKPIGENSGPEKPQLSPLQDIRDKGRKLELRLPSSGLQAGNNGPIRLAKVHVNSLNHVSLKRIIGGHVVLKPGYDYAVVLQPSADQPFREWKVIRQPVTGGGLDAKQDVVGTFRLNQKFELSFSWDKSNKSFEMINCLLELEAGAPDQKIETEKCVLREVEHVSPIHFDLTKAQRSQRLITRSLITDVQALELSCEYVNLPETVSRQGEGVLRVGESVKFLVQPPTTGRYARKVTMTVYFDETEQDVQVRIEAVAEIPVVNKLDDEVTMEAFSWKPGLSARVDEDIEAYGNDVNKWREELKEKEVAVESGRSSRNEMEQKNFENRVNSLRDKVNKKSGVHAELKMHFADLQKLMADIAERGQFKCSLRLKVPDSDPGGIELLVTDGPDTTLKE